MQECPPDEADCQGGEAMSATMTIGNVEITAVLDAHASGACSMIFPSVSSDSWSRHREFLTGDGDEVPISMSSYLLRSHGKTVLVDTGIGAKNRPMFPKGRLPDALADIGVRLDEIDVVLATH